MVQVKKIIIPLLFFSIACLASNHSFSQQLKKEIKPDQYRIVHWTAEQGLSGSQSIAMIKDVNGFLWVGSGGDQESELCRFDGAVFKRYFPDSNKRGSINSGSIYSFKEDSLHNLWIGTDKGLSRYDIKADTFTNFSPYYVDSALEYLRMAPFWATKDEMFCMEPGSVITAFNIYTLKRRKLVQIPKGVEAGIHHNTNKSFFQAGSNSVWKLVYYGNEYAELQQIFLDNGKTKEYPWPCYRKDVKHRHNAEDIRYDPKRNSIWINSGDGLFEFSLNDKQYHRVEIDFTNSKDYDRGVGIDIDRAGRIWFSTFFKGIFIYDPETGSIIPALSDPFLQKEAGDANLHIYCDRDGIVWTSNWNALGLYALLPHNSLVKRYYANPSKKDSLSSSVVSTIMPGPQGKLWIGTADGMNIYDPLTERFEVLRERDLPGITGKAIIPLYIDTIKQKAWINAGSQQTFQQYFGMTMYEMDIKTKKCRPIAFRDGTKQIDTFVVPHTLVRPYKNGIMFCDEKHGIFEIKEGSLVADLVLAHAPKTGFGSIMLKNDSSLFLNHGGALPNSTFENKNGKWIKTPHFLDSLFWTCILYDKRDQTYWVSFQKKLIHYDHSFGEIKTYSWEDGYTSVFKNMEFDNDGNLWFINFQNQLGRFNTVTGLFTIFSETDGHAKRDYGWYVPITKDVSGNIYTGLGWQMIYSELDWGFDRIYPERYSAENSTIVYLQSLDINHTPFPLAEDIHSLEALALRYNQKNIRIETGIINFFAKGRGNIRYQLEKNGEAGEWLYPPDYTIRLEDLSPGFYRLVMQASNASKEFIGPEKILMINISSPFWQTWWFRILAVIFVFGMIYGIVQYRSRSLRKRNVELEEKVLLRTKELKHSLEELRGTQQQLIQSEKMASLGELTAGIAHEIQNPLNFVNNFSEVSNELIDEMKAELDKGDTNEAKNIADEVKQNLEKILHHGKRADGIVKGMLQHSRTSSGQKEPTDINVLADEYLRLAYHGLRAKDKSFNAKFESDFDNSIGKLNIISQDIGRVILNLINNAFYAASLPSTNGGGVKDPNYNHDPTVWVSTKKVGDKVLISVRDNGPGIPQKILDKIFQPFFTTKPTGQGTGLGLSLSYDIVKAHGGELKVDTKEGEGTVFVIHLPT